MEVLHAGRGGLICCEKPMELLKEQTGEAGMEKHVPVIEVTETGVKVKVGSIPHPMEAEHYIEWIETVVEGESSRKFMTPGESPEAEFKVKGEKINAREYCNRHGLWRS